MQQRPHNTGILSMGNASLLSVPHYAAEVSSASAGSGGGSCAADSQTTAAVRTARSRATPAPTPVAIAQLKASTKGALRSAATFGGVDPRSVLQRTSKSRCVASAATDPTPTLTPFQPYFLTICTLGSYPDHICPHQKRTSRALTSWPPTSPGLCWESSAGIFRPTRCRWISSDALEPSGQGPRMRAGS